QVAGRRRRAVRGRRDLAERRQVGQPVVERDQQPAGGGGVEERGEALEVGGEMADDEHGQRAEGREDRRRERREQQRHRGEQRQLEVAQRDGRPQRGQQRGGAGQDAQQDQ